MTRAGVSGLLTRVLISGVGLAIVGGGGLLAAGCSGDKGSPGAPGAPGAAGTPGAPGTPGTNGTPATNGAPGAPGTPGTNGTNGTNGATGATGATGASGQVALSISERHGSDYLLTIGEFDPAVTAPDPAKQLVNAQITGASISAGVVTVNFRVDTRGPSPQPVTTLTSVQGLVAQLIPDVASGVNPTGAVYSRWEPYIWTSGSTWTQSGDQTWKNAPWNTPTTAKADQVSRSGGKSGTVFTNYNNGTYQLQFVMQTQTAVTPKRTLPASNPSWLHRVTVAFGGHDGPTAEAFYDFRPDGGLITPAITRDIIRTETCYKCHGANEFHGHGGDRVTLQGCVTCHVEYMFDPESGYTLDMKEMIHRIHGGGEVASAAGPDGAVFDDPATSVDESLDNWATSATGKPYVIWARGTKHDWSKVGFPAMAANCQACHEGDPAVVKNADNWKMKPSKLACGSCHDDINWATGAGHGGGVQPESACAGCHPAAGSILPATNIWPIPASHDWIARTAHENPEFAVDVSVSNPTDNVSFKGNETPVVTLRMTDLLIQAQDWTVANGSNTAITAGSAALNNDGDVTTHFYLGQRVKLGNDPAWNVVTGEVYNAGTDQTTITLQNPYNGTGTTVKFQGAVDHSGTFLNMRKDGTADRSGPRDGLLADADLYIQGPRSRMLPALTTAARAQVLTADAGPWDFTPGGGSLTAANPTFQLTVDSGVSIQNPNPVSLATATWPATISVSLMRSGKIAAGSNGQALPQATISVASTLGFPPAGTIEIETSAGVWEAVTYTGLTSNSFTGCASAGTGTMNTDEAVRVPTSAYFANIAAVTPAEVANWLTADPYFNARCIASVESATSPAIPGRLSVRSRNYGIQPSLQLVDPAAGTDILDLLFATDTAVKLGTNGAKLYANAVPPALNAANDPKVRWFEDRVEYHLDPVTDLQPGTYVVFARFGDRGNNRSFPDWWTKSTTTAEIRVKAPTSGALQASDKRIAAGCNTCHQNPIDGRGLTLHSGYGAILNDDATDRCTACHDYLNNSVTVSAEPYWSSGHPISKRVHGIHNGSNLSYPLETVGYSGGDHIKGRNWDIAFPMDIRNCESCHTASTSGSWKTNANRLACRGCHDSDKAQTHFRAMTWDPTPATPFSGDEDESCNVCH